MATVAKVICATLLLTAFTCAQQFDGDSCTTTDGADGVCKNIEKCEEAKKLLASGIFPKICGFENSLPVVCCSSPRAVTKPTIKSTTSTTTPPPNPEELKSLSKRKCREYSQYVYIKEGGGTPLVPSYAPSKGESQCIDGSTPQIVGGEPAEPKEFPHMANIGFGNKESITWACGGSLISERFVLTAAHCLYSRDLGIAKWIRLGDLNIKTTDDNTKTQDFSIKEMIRHPEYAAPSHYHDIALIRLDRDATFDGYVRPACIHVDETLPNKNFTATGWGSTDWTGSKGSDALLKVGLPTVDPSICNDTYSHMIGGRKLRVGITSDTMLCVGVLDGGKDTCQGDSGGPIQDKLTDPYCMYDVVGVTSFGSFCGARNSPAVYTRVSHYVPWIESIVWP